jgi:hypothetical protein
MLHVSLILAHGPHGVVVRGELHVGLARGPPGVVLQQAHVDRDDRLEEISNIRCRGLEREPPHVDAVQVPRVPVARLVGLPPRVDLVRAAPPSSRLAPVVVVPDPVGRRSVVVVVVGGVVGEVCPLEVARTSRLEPVRVAEPVASVIRARPGVVHSGVGTAAPVRVAQHAVHFGQAATKDFDVSGEKTPK